MFWGLSFRQLQLFLQASGTRSQAERNELLSAAWHAAAFQRAKKMPKHSEVVQEPKQASPAPDALRAKVASWLANRKK